MLILPACIPKCEARTVGADIWAPSTLSNNTFSSTEITFVSIYTSWNAILLLHDDGIENN